MSSPTSSTPTHREHAPPNLADVDFPFPYPPTLEPSSNAPPGSPANSLDFFLKSTNTNNVQDLKRHADEIQKEAYARWPYPCIKRWAFLTTKAAKSSVYPQVLAIGSSDPSAIYLDLGCFCGTDVRKLVVDGWNPRRVIGSDLREEWFELGYRLFGDGDGRKDGESPGIRFVKGDVFDDRFLGHLPRPSVTTGTESIKNEHENGQGKANENENENESETPLDLQTVTSLNDLAGHIRCLSTFSFFHLFDREAQRDLADRLAGILSPRKGSIIFGSHQGMKVPGNRRGIGQGELFGHSPESWKDLWELDIFPASRGSPAQSGTRVRVHAELDENDAFPPASGAGKKDEEGRSSPSMLMRWSVTVV